MGEKGEQGARGNRGPRGEPVGDRDVKGDLPAAHSLFVLLPVLSESRSKSVFREPESGPISVLSF